MIFIIRGIRRIITHRITIPTSKAAIVRPINLTIHIIILMILIITTIMIIIIITADIIIPTMTITEDFILIVVGDLDLGIRFILTATTFGVSTVGFIPDIGKVGIIFTDTEIMQAEAADMEAGVL